MSVSKEYIDFIVDQLSPVGRITVKRMFGGAGIYSDALFFAIIENDTLRFKVDDTNRADFEALGIEAFKPYKDKEHTMQYYEVPIEVLEDKQALGELAFKALTVARAAKKKRKKPGK